MGREIKRVPLDFDWPLERPWKGYLMPEKFREDECPDCEMGYSPYADHLYKQWYGNAPFRPESTGSVPFTDESAPVRRFAERNVTSAPEFYGHGELSIQREARRLADLFNRQWSHHLSQEDVDALFDQGRLSHSGLGEGATAQQVNDWSVGGMGHDAINCGIVIAARCVREGEPSVCQTCLGYASLETYPGQREEAEAWERSEPPTGDGWQVWETVSEGSPITPVLPDKDALVNWLMSPDYRWGTSRPLTREQAENFVHAAWAPSLVVIDGEVKSGDSVSPARDSD